MGKAENFALIILILSLSLLLSLSASAQEKVNSFTGNVTIGGSSSTNGAVAEAFIGSSSTADKSYTVGALPSVGSGRYILDFECNSGSVAFLKVWGINATTQTCSNLLIKDTNLSVSLVANDGACSYGNACSSVFCCSSNTAINTSGGSGACQAVACGTGITIPSFALNSTSIINTQTLNFTINISSALRYNITAANFTLVSSASVVSRNFTIPSNSRNLNISYQIFASADTAIPGTYNITAVQVNDNGSIVNRTAITTLNFTVASRLTVPSFALSVASITTAQTVNFTINLSNTYYNITSANFTLVTGSTVISRNFTIPSSGKDFNLSYKIFASSETASAGTYNVTAVQVNDNGSITNLTAITNMNFTVTSVATPTPDTGGGGPSGGGGDGGAAPVPAPEAPSQETVDTVKEALPEAFKEADAAGNVEIKTVAAPEIKTVPAGSEAAASALEYAVDYLAKTESAQQALSAIQEAVSSGGASTVSVKKTIEVVKATNKVSKEEVVVSVVKLSVTAPGNQDLKNVEVVEVIPKAAASNVNQVTFKGDQPQVLEADPVVKWFFSQVAKGTTKDLGYTVNKDIRNIGTTTVGVQGRAEATPPAAPPAPPAAEKEREAEKPGEVKKPTPVGTMILVVVVALLVVAGWLFVKTRKKPMK